MNEMQEAKIQRLLDTLQESRVLLMRMQVTCEQIEKELRAAINDDTPKVA